MGVSSTAALGGRNFLRPFFFVAGLPPANGDLLGVAAAEKWTTEEFDTNLRYGGIKDENCWLSVENVDGSNAPVGRVEDA